MGTSRSTASLDTPAAEAGRAWSLRRRAIVSVLILLHLAAVVTAPFSNPPPASDLSRKLAYLFRPYLHAAFLFHGYRFFAPNPGVSHLLLYELDLPDGSVVKGQYPDIRQHWPRLLYHRHFMISESAYLIVAPFISSDNEGRLYVMSDEESDRAVSSLFDDAQVAANNLREAGFPAQAERVLRDARREQEDYRRMKRRRDLFLTAIARNLLDEHSADRVRLFIQTHEIPPPIDAETNIPINDPRYYTPPILVADYAKDEL